MSPVEQGRIVGVGRLFSSGSSVMGFSSGHFFGKFSSFSRLFPGFAPGRLGRRIGGKRLRSHPIQLMQEE